MERLSRDWARQVADALGDSTIVEQSDTRFLRFLVDRLDHEGFRNLSFAIMRSAADVGRDDGEREELDALVDLGIEILTREGRPLQGVRFPGGSAMGELETNEVNDPS